MAVTTAAGTTDVLVSSVTSPLTVAYSRAPVAGELLRVDVEVRRATTVPPAVTIAGYTVGPTKTMSAGAGAEQARLTQFWRVADGTEGASISIAFTGSSAQALLRDRVGLDPTTPHDADGVGVTSNANTATLTPAVTPVAASAWIDTATAFSNAATGVTFGGGSTVDDALSPANNVGIATGTQTVSSPGVAVSPTAAWTGGSTSTFIASSMSFKLASTTDIGSAAMQATASLGASGIDTITDSAAMQATASLGASGVDTELPAAAMQATASLGLTGVDTILPSAAMQATASLGASAKDTELPSAAMQATASLGLTGAHTILPSDAMQATASLGLVGLDQLSALATMQAIASLGAVADVGPATRDITLIVVPVVVTWLAGPATSSAYIPVPPVTTWAAGPATTF